MAQMESDDVERVRDFRMGERPRRIEEMRTADLSVARRWCMRFGLGGFSGIAGGSAVRLSRAPGCSRSDTASSVTPVPLSPCISVALLLTLPARLLLPALATGGPPAAICRSSRASSSAAQRSQRSHPRNVRPEA